MHRPTLRLGSRRSICELSSNVQIQCSVLKRAKVLSFKFLPSRNWHFPIVFSFYISLPQFRNQNQTKTITSSMKDIIEDTLQDCRSSVLPFEVVNAIMAIAVTTINPQSVSAIALVKFLGDSNSLVERETARIRKPSEVIYHSGRIEAILGMNAFITSLTVRLIGGGHGHLLSFLRDGPWALIFDSLFRHPIILGFQTRI